MLLWKVEIIYNFQEDKDKAYHSSKETSWKYAPSILMPWM